MKRIILLIILLLLASLMLTAKVVVFPDLMKPYQIQVDDHGIYITEGTTIYIYRLKDFSLHKKFGKEGEGPQEFMLPPPGSVVFTVQNNSLLVNSLGKLSYFTKDGDFQKEIKLSVTVGSWLRPIGNNKFVGITLRQEENKFYNTLNVFDAELKKGKEIYKFKSPLQPGKVDVVTIARQPLLCTWKDKMFFGGEEGEIYVFDGSGKKLPTIKHEYEKVKLTPERKKKYIDFFRSHPRFKNGWERFKNDVHFPAYLPVLRDLIVTDGKIYTLTYTEKDGKRKFYVSDTDGKGLRKIMLPLPEMSPIALYPYTIKNNTLYQLIENDDSEQWELHITEIKL
jgi:hypothetical protein